MEFLIGAKVKIVRGFCKNERGVIVNVGNGYNAEDGEYNLFFVQIRGTVYQLRSDDFIAA